MAAAMKLKSRNRTVLWTVISASAHDRTASGASSHASTKGLVPRLRPV